MIGKYYSMYPFQFSSLPWDDLTPSDKTLLSDWITTNVNTEADLERLYIQFGKQTILELLQ